jgi:5-formyltetrahydrofolate cyclo-ligase
LPKCAENCGLRFFWVTDVSRDIEPGKWGILEPAEERVCECTGEPFSVIMFPGVAFDREGRRIGYGAGYYDRMLARCGGNSLKVAPAYAFQVLPELPCGPLDARVDVIATEQETIRCRKAGGE